MKLFRFPIAKIVESVAYKYYACIHRKWFGFHVNCCKTSRIHALSRTCIYNVHASGALLSISLMAICVFSRLRLSTCRNLDGHNIHIHMVRMKMRKERERKKTWSNFQVVLQANWKRVYSRSICLWYQFFVVVKSFQQIDFMCIDRIFAYKYILIKKLWLLFVLYRYRRDVQFPYWMRNGIHTIDEIWPDSNIAFG